MTFFQLVELEKGVGKWVLSFFSFYNKKQTNKTKATNTSNTFSFICYFLGHSTISVTHSAA